MEKIRTARNEGKRAWLYNGKVVVAVFGPPGKIGQQDVSKEKIDNSIIGTKTIRATWMKRGEDSSLSLMCQTA